MMLRLVSSLAPGNNNLPKEGKEHNPIKPEPRSLFILFMAQKIWVSLYKVLWMTLRKLQKLDALFLSPSNRTKLPCIYFVLNRSILGNEELSSSLISFRR